MEVSLDGLQRNATLVVKELIDILLGISVTHAGNVWLLWTIVCVKSSMENCKGTG